MTPESEALSIVRRVLQQWFRSRAAELPSNWPQLSVVDLFPDHTDWAQFFDLLATEVFQSLFAIVYNSRSASRFGNFRDSLPQQTNMQDILRTLSALIRGEPGPRLVPDGSQAALPAVFAPAPPAPERPSAAAAPASTAAPPLPSSGGTGSPHPGPSAPPPDAEARSAAPTPEGTIPIVEEKLDAGKHPRKRTIDRSKFRIDRHILQEEVVVGKDSSERTEEIEDTLRHTEIEVGPLPAPPSPQLDAAARRINHPGQTSYGTTPATPNATVVRVFYATDRFRIPNPLGDPVYDHHRSLLGQLHYGECEVSVPKTHRTGHLETPSLLRFEFRPDPEKHIVLAKTTSLEKHLFFEQVRSSVERSGARDAFVFIHGYNVSFANAARRTGQIAYDLNFRGAPILYSWPSNGRVADYLKDETNITWSAPHLETFLSLLAQGSGADRIHLIAHSMGNRAVCEALRNLSRNPGSRLKLTHLVLAAPDIDAETFAELAHALAALSGRVTLYESSNDKAIHASKRLHGNPRAGEPLLVLPGLDTIDVSAIDTDFLGHSYFSDNWPLLSDIHSLIANDEAPGSRFGLTAMEIPAGRYFTFRP